MKCDKFRENFDELGPAGAHEAECTSCSAWAKQLRDLHLSVRSIPQYDVPEALTQRILTSLEHSHISAGARLGLLLPVAVAAVALLFTVAPMDSLDAIVSWLIGLAFIALMKFVVANPRIPDSTVETL